MKDFPAETREHAEDIAEDIREDYGDTPYEKAEGLMEYFEEENFNYGFWEGIDQGYFLRWPHEIDGQWECIEAAYYTYAVAEALDLDPRMISADNWRGYDTGHELVDVEGEDRRILVDPLNSMFGEVKYEEDEIKVRDNELTEKISMGCTDFEEIPKDMLIDRMEYYRSDEGILNLLEAGQKMGIPLLFKHWDFFVQYEPERQVLQYQIRFRPPFLDRVYYTEDIHFREGEASKMIAKGGIYSGSNWVKLKGKEPFWRKKYRKEGDEFRIEEHEELPMSEEKYDVMLEDVLVEVIEEKKTEHPTDPEKVLDDELDRPWVFADYNKPLEELMANIERLRSEGNTIEGSNSMQNLRTSYIKTVKDFHDDKEYMKNILDKARLNIELRKIAKEKEISRAKVCKNMLKKIGLSKQDIKERVDRIRNRHVIEGGRKMIGSGGSVGLELALQKDRLENFFERAYDRGLMV